MAIITDDWMKVLEPEFSKPYYRRLYEFIKKEYEEETIFPPATSIFNAYKYTDYNDVKVVIIGQDPYHEIGQAMGLAFSVNKGTCTPPSLVNIYKELSDDVGATYPGHGDISAWTKEGVLLLNTVLTVREHKADSHKGKGWEEFTDATIRALNNHDTPIVFMLWGAKAAEKEKMITNPNHLVLKAPHPSPLSAYRGFFGCKHFSKANEFLESHGLKPINWQV